MNALRPAFATLALLLGIAQAHAQCPTDDNSRFIEVRITGLEPEKRVLTPLDLDITVDEHTFDTLQIGVSEETLKRYRKAQLEDRPGTDVGLKLRISPRKAESGPSVITVAAGEQRLWVKTFRGSVCTSQYEMRLFGGDSRVTAVIVGINDYANVRDLKWAEKDAAGFETLIRERVPAPDLNVIPLLGPDATAKEVRAAIYRATTQASSAGTVLVYFSGHGTLHKDPLSGLISAYFVPQDGDLAYPDELIAHAAVVDRLSKTKATRKILISDSCFSGISLTRPSSLTPKDRVSKSLMDVNSTEFLAEALSKQGEWLPTNRNLLWFSSSGGTEVSYEWTEDPQRPDRQHGVFTYYLMKSLEERSTYKQAKEFIVNKINAEREEMQTPDLSGRAEDHDLLFPLGGGAP